MTESEWLVSDDPVTMLNWRQGSNPLRENCPAPPLSDRKLRLFACACRRLAGSFDWTQAPPGGVPTWGDIEEHPEREVRANGHPHGAVIPAIEHASLFIRETRPVPADSPFTLALAAGLLREIVGNPFRLVFLPWRCCECGLAHGPPAAGYYCVRCGCDESYCPWLTPSVVALARCIYESRGFEDMPVLADALEEAGCDEPCRFCDGKGYHETGLVRCDQSGIHDSRQRLDCVACKGTGRVTSSMIEHLRSVGPHVRGCWVLDLLLGKE